MRPEFGTGSLLLEVAWAAGILVSSVLVAWLVLLVSRLVRRKVAGNKRTALLPQLLQSLSRPLFLLVVFEGLLLALSSLSYLELWMGVLGKAAIAGIIALVTYAIARIGQVLLSWYLQRVRVRRSLNRLAQRFVVILAYIVGLLVLLDYLGISVSPLIAGLGIGGLAIALALQPTLSNFFAGTQIVVDHVVREGDYIELDDGAVRGYVTNIGWRSTRIRTSFNNMVIVPNSRLADSVITNYYGPSMDMGVIVNGGVSYSSDLAQVERIAIEVAQEVIDDLDEAIKTFEPWFGFDEFADSNINFWVWLQAKDRIASFRVKSELIKRLKARFDQEGITINYPVRHLTFDRPDDAPPPFLSDRPDSEGKR